jgi:hypothetical protein
MTDDDEHWRRRDHHEILKMILGKLADSGLKYGSTVSETDVELAREIADFAYPPPQKGPGE